MVRLPMTVNSIRQAGQLGQVEEHEPQHHHPVEDALHDDGRQRSRDRHALFAAQHHRPDDFTGTRRIDVIPGIANGHDGEHGAGGDGFERAQQVMPAPGARPHRHKIHRHAGDDPQVVRLQDIRDQQVEVHIPQHPV
jgi:hypothetical protein